MKDIIVKPNITIGKSIKKMNECGVKCLVITDSNNLLLGTLSDGDIRKAILKGAVLSNSITDIYNQNPTSIIEGNYNIIEVKELFTKYKFDIIPVVNHKLEFKDVLFWDSVLKKTNKGVKKNVDIPVVIMAGGKGNRLKPFTNVLPKPLVPIHEKPIIEHIIERFNNVGCSNFYLSINFKARIIKAYFEEQQPDYSVHFIEEREPLGTAGSLQYLDQKFSTPFFVTNCDIIIKEDYSTVYDFHNKGKYDITLVASAKEYIIPYGTCNLNIDGDLSHIDEKPHYDFLINTGLYILNPNVLKLIPKNKFYHITNLIDDAIKEGKKVGVFPIDDDSWIDIGQWAEYKKAVEKL